MVFRKGGTLPRQLKCLYGKKELEFTSQFSYLGIVFSTGGSFSHAQCTLAGQAQKATFMLNKYLYKFNDLTPKHVLELFDKLVLPILSYGSETWGFGQANQIERIHLQFCKRLLCVKISTQNDFIYGEHGRTTLHTKRLFNIIKYSFKIISMPDRKYVKCIYSMMLNDMHDMPNKVNWSFLSEIC